MPIHIVDSKAKGSKYRVKVVAPNGKGTGGDWGFNSAAAVNKHLRSNNKTWGGVQHKDSIAILYFGLSVVDKTEKQSFIRYGAKSGLKVKPKSKKK